MLLTCWFCTVSTLELDSVAPWTALAAACACSKFPCKGIHPNTALATGCDLAISGVLSAEIGWEGRTLKGGGASDLSFGF